MTDHNASTKESYKQGYGVHIGRKNRAHDEFHLAVLPTKQTKLLSFQSQEILQSVCCTITNYIKPNGINAPKKFNSPN